MRPLSDADIVRVWEYGYNASTMRRAMALIAAASEPEEGEVTRLASLTPGERDARLLSIRCNTFGSQLECVAICPSCGEQLEFIEDANVLFPNAGADYAADVQPATLTESGYTVTVRPPTIGEVEQAGLPGAKSLIDRCVLHAEHEGQAISAGQLPTRLVDAIDAHLGTADPAAITEVEMTCPACSHVWVQVFDVFAFFWTEISARAERLFREVHALAQAYGWSESEILHLGASTRQRYLELVRG